MSQPDPLERAEMDIDPGILGRHHRTNDRMEDADPTVHCTLTSAVDLLAGLESAHIEHLDVDAERVIVIYQSAILMVVATEGDATAARAFDVELWEPPIYGHDRDAEDILQTFIEEFTSILPATRRDD